MRYLIIEDDNNVLDLGEFEYAVDAQVAALDELGIDVWRWERDRFVNEVTNGEALLVAQVEISRDDYDIRGSEVL